MRTLKTPMKTSAKTKSSAHKSKKHVRSNLLSADPRAAQAPRHMEVVHSDDKLVVMVKIYEGLGAPGSELMTVSCVCASDGVEKEIRYDEKFPVWMRFKKEDDIKRVVNAKDQIVKLVGFQKILALFEQIKFSA